MKLANVCADCSLNDQIHTAQMFVEKLKKEKNHNGGVIGSKTKKKKKLIMWVTKTRQAMNDQCKRALDVNWWDVHKAREEEDMVPKKWI